MENELIEAIKNISIVLGFMGSLFAVYSNLKKYGTLRTLSKIAAFALSILFMKHLIVITAENLDLLYLPALVYLIVTIANVASYLIDKYQNEFFRLSRSEYIRTHVLCSDNIAFFFLLLMPIWGYSINFIFHEPHDPQILVYINDLKSRKINLELYRFLYSNSLFSIYYVVKIVEIIISWYFCSIGSRGIRGEYIPAGKLCLLIFGAFATLFFASSNWCYEWLKVILAQFG